MQFTFSWLKEHLDTNISVTEITDRLSMLGLEVETVDNTAEKLLPFVIGQIKRVDPHPNADRLKLCIIDTGR